jgi:hypothetical protein
LSFQCEKCERSFQSQDELDKHLRIYGYTERHDLDGLEETVSFLMHTRKIDRENNAKIYKFYDELERKFYRLVESHKVGVVPESKLGQVKLLAFETLSLDAKKMSEATQC